jgi:hypothetical protein
MTNEIICKGCEKSPLECLCGIEEAKTKAGQNRAKKKLTDRAWRLKNKDKNRLYSKVYYYRNIKKMREYNGKYYPTYYQRTKTAHDLRTAKYKLSHRAQVNEWYRNRIREKKDQEDKVKTFSFYREIIMSLKLLPDSYESIKKDFWIHIFKLTLTDKQRQLAKLTQLNFTQSQIEDKLKISQSSCCKMWNGNQIYVGKYKGTGRKLGGIYTKLKKAMLKDNKLDDFMKMLFSLLEKYNLVYINEEK